MMKCWKPWGMKMENKKEVSHTLKEIKNWKLFEEVRSGGRFNMYDPRARTLTGLSDAEYRYCMKNYGTLQAQAEGKGK